MIDYKKEVISTLQNHALNIQAVSLMEKQKEVIEAKVVATEKQIQIVEAALEQLPEAERLVLTEYYVKNKDKTKLYIEVKLCEMLYLGRSRVQELRVNALKEMARLLNGCVVDLEEGDPQC